MPNLWTARDLEAANPRTTKLALDRAGVVASFRDVLDAWGTDPAFCGWFGDQLAASTFSAFKWETPPVRDESLDQPFELVLLDAPSLARTPDPDAFAEHFADPRRGDVLAFENLGGDAMMVVPRPLAAPDAYGHLAAFVRRAPAAQRELLWRVVSEAMAARVGARPVWLSTAGGGVAWLHVRLDSRPKYHGYAPYRDADGRRSNVT